MLTKVAYHDDVIYFTKKLDNRLKDIPNFELTVLEAPMGYGKTTTMRFFAQKANMKILWHSVYAGGLSYFWDSFYKAVAPLSGELAVKLKRLGSPGDAVLVQKAVELICGVRLAQETLLVIDDYHFVDSPTVDAFFSFLLVNLPPQLHLVVMSRSEFLGEKVAELRLKGLVNYIGKEDFLLQPGDIADYYARCGIIVTAEDERKLFAYSEGWITPLYLAMREYIAHGKFTTSGSVSALIGSIVYQPLGNELKAFLQALSLFDFFSAEQAQHMWPRGNAAVLLEALMRHNTFLSRDADTGLYAFHNLFLAHIRDAFAAQGEETKKALWDRAGYWHLKNGDCVQAMACFEQTGDFALVLRTLAQTKGANVTGEHKGTILACFDRCPPAIKAGNPAALLVFIRFLISYNESARMQEACAIFEQAASSFASLPAEKNALMMEYERLLSLTKYNNIREMARHHQNALRYMERPVTGEETKGNWTFGSPSVLLMFYRESGRLTEHIEDMKNCLSDYCRLTDGHGSGAEYVMEAEAALNRGETDIAATVIHKGLHYAREKEQWSVLLAAGFVQIRLALLHGNYFEAMALKRSMSDLIEDKQQYLLLHTLDICEAYFHLLLGLTDRTPSWIAGGDYQNTRLMFPALPAVQIVYGRYLLLCGEYRQLIGLADVFLDTSSHYPNLISRIYTMIYLAVAYHKLARSVEAFSSLQEALDIALPDRIYLPFAENGSIIALLRQMMGKTAYGSHIKQIIALYKKQEQGRKQILQAHFAEVVPGLTDRENDVATLAAAGLCNREIAGRLQISENTVKARLKAVFEKLAVASRVQLRDRLPKQ